MILAAVRVCDAGELPELFSANVVLAFDPAPPVLTLDSDIRLLPVSEILTEALSAQRAVKGTVPLDGVPAETRLLDVVLVPQSVPPQVPLIASAKFVAVVLVPEMWTWLAPGLLEVTNVYVPPDPIVTVSLLLGVLEIVTLPVPCVAFVVKEVPLMVTPCPFAKQKLEPTVMLPVAAVERLAVNTSDPPTVTVCPLVGLPVKLPVCDAAVGGLASNTTPSTVRVELPLMLVELRVPTTPVRLAVPEAPIVMLQSFLIGFLSGGGGGVGLLRAASAAAFPAFTIVMREAKSGALASCRCSALRFNCCNW
jgi:hypothetical protein